MIEESTARAPDRSQRGKIDRARYQRITHFFARVIVHLVWWDIFLRRLAEQRVLDSRSDRWRGLARRFRELAVDMGGVLIKLGQFLSTRVDVLPPEITDELRGLQDEVPAVELRVIRQVLVQELGDPAVHFREIEESPLAAASLGQVHRAWLHPNGDTDATEGRGQPVVIKVQRPGIVQLVQTDLAALRVVARWIMRYPPIRRRADMPALLEEFARTLWEELDYEQEARNADRFGEMFARDPGVYIPSVYRRHSTRRVLVLENVEAIKIVDLTALDAAGISRRQVADRLLDTYFWQIFNEGFFHADPHPGNLFVKPEDPVATDEEGNRTFSLIFVDFGMVGRIKSLMGENLRKLLVGVTQRDARALTLAYRDLGFFLPGADLDRITEAQTRLLDELWGRDLLELTRPDPREVQALGREFRDILFDFPFQIPQDFVYLGRALGILSGLASQLDPQMNPWYKVEQYGRALIRTKDVQRAGLETLLQTVKPFVTLPAQLERVLRMAEQGNLHVEMGPDPSTLRRLDRLDRRLQQLQATVLAGAGILSAALYFLMRQRNDEA